MSKYQKLNENLYYANEHDTVSSHINGIDEDDDDEEYSTLFLDDNYNSKIISNSYSNNKNTGIIISHGNSNSSRNSRNSSLDGELLNNNQQHDFISNSTEGNNTTQTNLDAEESIMEVPLLHGDDNNYDDEPVLQQRPSLKTCRCNQPGFAANLKTKSTQEAKCKILLAISLCCIFMIIEFLGGYIAGSLAIMTDAAHLASDCISFIIGLMAIWIGSRKPDSRMSFGYKRMEVMGALLSILGVWILTATLVMMAIERIYSNDFDLDANTMMTISGIGILINIAMIFILHGSLLLPAGFTHGHSHAHAHAHPHLQAHNDTQLTITIPETDMSMCENSMMTAGETRLVGNGNLIKRPKRKSISDGHAEKNLNLRAAMIHVIGDLVQSIGVFLAAILIKIIPSAKFADPLCTILFSIIVIMTTARLFKESVEILLDAVPKGVSLDELETDLLHIDGVKGIHHLNVWRHTSNFNVLMVHLVIDLLTDSNTVLDKTTQLAQSSKYDIKHCTIQIERLNS